MKKRTVGVCCLMAMSGLGMSAQKAHAGSYELLGSWGWKGPESPKTISAPTAEGVTDDSLQNYLSVECSAADGKSKATASASPTDSAASVTLSASSTNTTPDDLPDLEHPVDFAKAGASSTVYLLKAWDWAAADDEGAETPIPYKITLPAVSTEHNVEATGSDSGLSVAAGSESVYFSAGGNGYQMDSDGGVFNIAAFTTGEHPKSIRTAMPRDMVATGQGYNELHGYIAADCYSYGETRGTGSVKVGKQQAQFGDLSLAPQ